MHSGVIDPSWCRKDAGSLFLRDPTKFSRKIGLIKYLCGVFFVEFCACFQRVSPAFLSNFASVFLACGLVIAFGRNSVYTVWNPK